MKLTLTLFLFPLFLYAENADKKEIITLFAHGLKRSKDDIHTYLQDTIMTTVHTFNFPEAEGKQSGVGHGPDFAYLSEQFQRDADYIGFGFSRGAAALLSYVAQTNDSRVKALVLEGAPADVVDLVRDVQLKTIGIDFFPCRHARERIFNYLFPGYPLYSTPVLEQLKHIQNKNTPIIIFHSKQDKRVPITSAWHLYNTLKKAEFPNVYLHEIEEGDHGLAFHKEAIEKTEKRYHKKVDTKRFLHHQYVALRSLHTFYKEYNLPYQETYYAYQPTHETKPFTLQNLQPSIEEIEEKITREEERIYSFQNNIVKKTFITTIALSATYGIAKLAIIASSRIKK